MKDIMLYQFNASTEFEKGEILFEYAVHLSERFGEKCSYSLYQLNDFYVEVLYNVSKNKIVQLISFKNASRLEPYLEKIDLSSILWP